MIVHAYKFAARLIFRVGRFECVSRLLKELAWFPVWGNCRFKNFYSVSMHSYGEENPYIIHTALKLDPKQMGEQRQQRMIAEHL